MKTPQVLVLTAGSWHLPETAAAFEARGALAGLWMSDRNKGRVPAEKFNWCWPFYLATKPLHVTPLRGYWAERIFWEALPLWQRWLARQSFPPCDVVHARMGYALEPFARARNTSTRVLKVVDCTNSHPATQAGYWQRELDRFAPGTRPIVPDFFFERMRHELELADVVLCPSDFVRETMAAHGVPDEKCFVAPYGFDARLFPPRQDLPATPRFLFTGTLCFRKGVHYLLRAFALVQKRLPEARLTLIGGIHPEFAEEFEPWRDRGLHIEHVPYAPQTRVAEALQEATAYVFPSCEEGCARSLLEALGAGVPVVSSHESGASNFLGDGAAGFLIDPRHVDGIADAMLRLAADPDLNRRMGAAARAKIIGRTWSAYAAELLAHYQERRFVLAD